MLTPALRSGRFQLEPRAKQPNPSHQEAHRHASLRGGDEAVAKPRPRRVVADQVKLRVDVVARAVDGVAQRVVHGLPVDEHVDLVAVGRPQVREALPDAEHRLLERAHSHDAQVRRPVRVGRLVARGRHLRAHDRIELALGRAGSRTRSRPKRRKRIDPTAGRKTSTRIHAIVDDGSLRRTSTSGMSASAIRKKTTRRTR